MIFFRIGLFLYCVLLVILILFCVIPVIAVSQLEMHVRLICVIKFYFLTYLSCREVFEGSPLEAKTKTTASAFRGQ